MRKRSILLLLAIAALFVAIPARAEMDDEGGGKWTIHGDIRVRGDYFENYDFAEDDNGGADDNAAIWPYTVRVGVDGQITDNVKAMVDFRMDSTFGGSPSFNEFGGASPTFFSSAYSSEDNINVYQGWVQIDKVFGMDNFSARIGRQEHTYGTELLMGDNDFYNGQAFDGVRLMWLHDRWDANAFYYKLSEVNFNHPNLFLGVNGGSEDTNFMGGTFDWKFGGKLGTVGAYYLRYQDLGNNPTFNVAGDAGIDTYGVRWGKMAGDEGMFDWNVEYASQSGDIGNDPTSTDLSSDVLEGWFGFSLHPGNSHHRFHVGYLNASGDDPNTTDFEGFFPLFNDGHAHNRLGNLDNFGLSDVEDINAGYTGRFGDKHTIMVAAHMLKLDQPVATSLTTTEDDLGMAWDINYMYAMNKNVGFEVNFSQSQPGDLQDALPFLTSGSADTAARYYAQMHVRW